jgi:hypothetical protein
VRFVTVASGVTLSDSCWLRVTDGESDADCERAPGERVMLIEDVIVIDKDRDEEALDAAEIVSVLLLLLESRSEGVSCVVDSDELLVCSVVWLSVLDFVSVGDRVNVCDTDSVRELGAVIVMLPVVEKLLVTSAVCDDESEYESDKERITVKVSVEDSEGVAESVAERCGEAVLLIV